MITVIFINIFAIFIAYLGKYKNIKYGLETAFLLLIIFLSIRYNYGNDYNSYYNHFKSINSNHELNLSWDNSEQELGWVILNRIFKPLGFFSLVAALTIFQGTVLYKFIKRYIPTKYYWLAVFIFCFGSEYMLVQSSMMRQTLAMTLFIIGINYIIKKRFFPYLILILLATSFHRSAIVLIPIYFLNINFRFNKIWIIGILSLFLTTISYQSFFADEISKLVSQNFTKYTYYLSNKETVTTGAGFIFQFIVFIFILLNERKQNQQNSILFKISILGFLIVPLGFTYPMISRIGMYMAVVNIIVIPLLINSFKKVSFKISFTFAILFWHLYNFYIFFNSDVWIDAFRTYNTIFSSEIQW